MVNVETKLPLLRRLSPYPNLFMKNSKSRSRSTASQLQGLSKISAYCPRNNSDEGHTFRSVLPS